ncbi:MAG TPA: CHAD domain-containing protein [Solirubrobacterales bacterium]|jgi:CYTH domain-containing protein/CHAD domain-containing protein
MATEIERKFVLEMMPPEAAGARERAIEQGYLAVDDELEVRLRRCGGERLLTAKRGHGESREEVELRLYGEQFEALWPLTEGRRLRKSRREVPLGDGLTAEVDRYEGDLAGLLVAEVEFPSVEASRAFRPPPWLGREVSGERRYANQVLAREGLPLDPAEVRGETSRSMDEPGSMDEREGSGHGAYRLEADEPAPAGLQRIAAARARRARKMLGEVEGEGAVAIHGARKDLKKLRAMVRLLREELGEKSYRAQNRRYREAGRLLSDARDAEVKVETLDDLEQRFGDELSAAAIEHWRRDLARERYAAGADANGELGERVKEAVASIEAGRNEIGHWDLGKDSWKLVEPGLLRAYADGREALAEVREEPSDESVHQWRKRAKDLWYQLRLLRELWPEVLGETADQAHELADQLGDHHDLAVLAEDLEGRDAVDPEPIRELIARRQEELLGQALAIGERLYAEKPKAFGKRIKAYWKVARG